MKKTKVIALLISVLLLVSPLAVFAQNNDSKAVAGAQSGQQEEQQQEEEQVQTGWNDDRTVYYDKSGQPTTGLFKAPMPDGVGALFYANDKGVVRKKSGIVTVDGSKKRFLRSKDSEGHWGFRAVKSSNKNTYKYLIGNTGTGAIIEDAGIHATDSGKKYYVQNNGTVKAKAGLVEVNGKTYFVNKYGRVRTEPGWLYHNGKKYRVLNNGVIRTREGVLIINGKRYIVLSGGEICRTVGAVKANGKVYYVRDSKGHLGKKKAYKVDGKVYHVNKYGVVYVGRHKWNGKLYFSVNKGYLRLKSGTVTRDGKRFFVEAGGLILTDQKISYKGKEFIAGEDGYFKTGLFKWKGSLWYANKYGVLKKKAGIVKAGNYSYYVAAGGKVYVDRKIKADGKMYIADSSGHLQTGFFKWKKRDYYAESDFVVYADKKFTIDGKTYIAAADGHLRTKRFKWKGYWWFANDNHVIYTDKKFQSGGYTYIADKDGHLKTGTFMWKDGYYYITNDKCRVYINKKFKSDGYTYIADSEGHLISGMFKWNGYYYIAKDKYRIKVNKKFKYNGSTYISDENGHLMSGVFKWKKYNTYYYAETNYALHTTEEIIKYGGKYYYNKNGGGLAVNKWVEDDDTHYYAGSDAAFMTETFEYNGVSITPGSDGSVSEEDYKRATQGEE